MSTLNSNRPINQGVFTSRLPLAALASITHRITGVLLLAGVGLLIYLADVALSSEAGFADARALIDAGGLVTFLLWATLVAICYHFLAGVKHLLLDFHIGDNVRAAFGMSIAVIVLTAIDAIWLGGMAVVTNATSFSRSGLSDFIIQRLTAVVLGAYALCVLAFFVGHPGLDYAALTGFFGNFSMKIFSTAAVLSTVAHAWIGLWTVGTDYLLPGHLGKSATSIRFIYQMGCFLILFVYLVWAIQLFWSL